MKYFIFLVFTFSLTETISAQEKVPNKMPPLEMLPKVGENPKKIYELEDSTSYSVFDSNGVIVSSGNGEFIDCTKFKKGVYFIRFEGKTEKFEIE